MTGGVAIFAGPSVPLPTRSRWPDLCWLPPAQGGDFLRLGREFATIILIDGYFEHRSAPFHKEIMHCLADERAVWGASSMGALRAAELDCVGMVGVGTIYSAYKQGLWHGDDEVALVHAPERLGWQPLSIPMVEIRATLALALREGWMDRDQAMRLRAVAHALHFAERDWPALCRAWNRNGASVDLCDWLRANHVPLKQIDAERCIARALGGETNIGAPCQVPQTVFLQRIQAEVSASAASAMANNLSPAPSLNG